MQEQAEGKSGKTIVSRDGKELTFAKCVEVISQFVPFELSRRSLVNKVIATIEKKAIQESYTSTMEIMTAIESFLMELIFDFPGDIVFQKIEIGAIIKSIGIRFCEDYDSLGEKIIDYMELVTEYDQSKLFILINLRNFITDREAQLFIDTVLQHQYHVLMIEGNAHSSLSKEKRYLIDLDCCEIQ